MNVIEFLIVIWTRKSVGISESSLEASMKVSIDSEERSMMMLKTNGTSSKSENDSSMQQGDNDSSSDSDEEEKIAKNSG